MGKLWVVIRREYLERVRTKWFIYGTVFGPLLFAGLMFVPPWLSRKGTKSQDISRIVVVDASGLRLGRAIAVELNGGLFGDTTRTRIVETAELGLDAAERAASEEVMRGAVKGYLVLGPRVAERREVKYAGRNATSPLDMQEIQRVVTRQLAIAQLERAGVPRDQAERLAAGEVRLQTERLTEKGRGGSGTVNILFAFFVAFLLYISIFIYGQNVLRGVMEEKQTRVAEVVMSSVPAQTLLDGKVLGVGAVGLTQTLIWMGTSLALYRARGPVLSHFGIAHTQMDLPDISVGAAALLIVYFLLGYIFYAALFAAVGAMVNSEQEAQQVQMPVASLLIASAAVIQPILFSPDGGLAFAASMIPFSAPIAVPLRLSVASPSAVEIGFSLVAMVLACVVALRLAARIYRTGLLMYGKRPTLGEVVRWIRYAP